MIAWLNPSAWGLLVLVAAPLVIHLLLRRRATRVPFPSIRFIAASDRSSTRMRRPSDPLLLVVRMAIVALSALAVARPLVLTGSRARTLGERAIRALVVDTSSSVDGARAAEAVSAETAGAIVSRRFDEADVGEGVRRASAWLASGEPGRREIVIISDFQRGSIDAHAFAALPEGIGLRTVRVAQRIAERSPFQASAVFHEGSAFTRTVHTGEPSTTVTFQPLLVTPGLEISADPSSTDRITRAIASAGGLAPSIAQPLALRFSAPQAASATDPWARGWTFDVARRLYASPVTGTVPIRALPAANRLVIDVGAPADTFAAAEITQAALNARFTPDDFAELEPASIPRDVLDSWARRPGPPDPGAWTRSHLSDGRWAWLAVIVLMAIETFLRRARIERQGAVEAHAA